MTDLITSSIPLAWTVDDACKRLSIGRTMLYQLMDEGELKPFRVGRRVLLPEIELQRWVSNKILEGEPK